jgi:phosphoribosylglycinamide formyltransferase-1
MGLETQDLVAVISGSGTTMKAIGEATKDGRLVRTKLVGIITTDPIKAALGIRRAINLGIPESKIKVIPNADYSADSLGEALKELNPDLIGLYGFLKKIPAQVIKDYPKRTINQHPGPIDPGPYDFGGHRMIGLRVHAARLAFVRATGRNFWTDVISQRVGEEYDQGKVLKRVTIPISTEDTAESLQKRALQYEWECQIATLRDFEEDGVIELPAYAEMGIDLVRAEEQELLQKLKKETIEAYKI